MDRQGYQGDPPCGDGPGRGTAAEVSSNGRRSPSGGVRFPNKGNGKCRDASLLLQVVKAAEKGKDKPPEHMGRSTRIDSRHGDTITTRQVQNLRVEGTVRFPLIFCVTKARKGVNNMIEVLNLATAEIESWDLEYYEIYLEECNRLHLAIVWVPYPIK